MLIWLLSGSHSRCVYSVCVCIFVCVCVRERECVVPCCVPTPPHPPSPSTTLYHHPLPPTHTSTPPQAARIALSAVITTTRARQLSTSHAQHIPDLTAALHTLSTHLRSHDAADYVLTHASAACALLRRCYVTLHWCLLQGGASVNRKLREAVVGGGPGEGTLVGLLVEVAAVDAELRRLYAQVLGERGQRWARCCQQAHAILEYGLCVCVGVCWCVIVCRRGYVQLLLCVLTSISQVYHKSHNFPAACVHI